MAIVTPLMLKQMYRDEELEKLSDQAHTLFHQNFHETVKKNKNFRRTGSLFPASDDKRSLSSKYANFNTHKPNISPSPEKRRPLSAPNKSPYYHEAPDSDDEVDLEAFEYRYDIESDVLEQDGGQGGDLTRCHSASSLHRGLGSRNLKLSKSASGPDFEAKLSYSHQFYNTHNRLQKSADSALNLPSIALGSTFQPAFQAAASSPKQYPPNLSSHHMKERRVKLKQESDALYQQVFEEAKLMQHKFVTCIHEANMFSKSLGRSATYRLLERSAHEDAAWEKIMREGEKERGGASIPRGTGKRIEKMLVEVTEDGRDIRYLGVNHFQREHSRLQVAVNKLLSVKPLLPISDPEEEERNLYAEKLEAEERERKKHNPGRRESHASQTAEHLNMAQSFARAQHAHKLGAVGDGEKQSKQAGSTNPSLQSRHEVEAQLQEILLKQTAKLRTLQQQLGQLKKIGWNMTVEEILASMNCN